MRYVVGLPGVILAFVWGVAEGSLFFIVPDVIISAAAMLAPRRAWRHVIAATLGSVVAGAFMYSWALREPAHAHDRVANVPFVTARMFDHVHQGFQNHPAGAVFLGPLSGVPYKIYAIEAPAFLPKPLFLTLTAPARAERFLAVWGLFAAIGLACRRYFNSRPLHLLLLHIVIWIVFYAFYWGRLAMQ